MMGGPKVPTHVRVWGEDHFIVFRRSERHGSEEMPVKKVLVWVAEIRVGLYAYGAWGFTRYMAYMNLRDRMKQIEEVQGYPPTNTADWQRALSEAVWWS